MKKWILKRKDGQVVSIVDSKPEDNGVLDIQEIELEEEELEEAKQAIGLKEENGRLISTDQDHLPLEIRSLVEKVDKGQTLTTSEKDELLITLVKNLL